MSSLVNTAGMPLTMSSLEIAGLTGKDHSHVMRDIRALEEALSTNPDLDSCVKSTTYTGKDGREYAQYELDKDTCLTLLLGYDAVARMKVVKRWQQLESGAAANLPNFADPAVAARAWAEQYEQKQIAVAQRDEAVKQKAWIGSKREATAMATAAAAKRESERLKAELGRNQQHATILAVERATGREFARNAFVGLRNVCKKYGLAAVEVVDVRYGSVKAWPAIAWRECYDIDLVELFGSERAVA